MAKLRGPDFISIQVSNFAKSRAFYTELLGFSADARFNTDDFILFETNSIPFALTTAKINLADAPQPGWGVTFWLDCDNVDDLHATLAAADVSILQTPFDGPFGRTFVFADPDGYRITANENPWERFPLGGAPQAQ